ncbi:MAG TPA: hypothetical protein VI316_07785 [Candidatus Dormibacteraeota bacterium]
MAMLESRWAPVSGILFVPLLVVGFGMVTTNLDTNKDPASKFVSYYSDSGNRAQILVGMYLVILASLAFAAFAGCLVVRVRAAGGSATALVASAAVFCTLLGLAGAAWGWLAGDIAFGGNPVPSGDLLRNLPQLGFPILLVPGAIAAAVFLAAAGLDGRRLGVLPGWLSILAFVAAALLLFSVAFFPFLALPLWVLVASITMLVRPVPEPVRLAPAPG